MESLQIRMKKGSLAVLQHMSSARRMKRQRPRGRGARHNCLHCPTHFPADFLHQRPLASSGALAYQSASSVA